MTLEGLKQEIEIEKLSHELKELQKSHEELPLLNKAVIGIVEEVKHWGSWVAQNELALAKIEGIREEPIEDLDDGLYTMDLTMRF